MHDLQEGTGWDYQRQADKHNKRMRDYWNHLNVDGDMRVCMHCGVNDDTIVEGNYWINHEECSGCVDGAEEPIKPLDGTNQEDELKKSN